MYGKKKIPVAMLLIFISALAFAGSPPPLTPAEIPNTDISSLQPSAGWFWMFLASREVMTVILAVISGIAGLLLRHRWVIKWRLGQAVQCLAAGVRETYEEYVRAAQKANSDGKLTVAERDQAMRMALDKAKAYALKQGFDLTKAYAKEFLPVIAERLIGVQKATGRGFPFEPLLPELEPR